MKDIGIRDGDSRLIAHKLIMNPHASDAHTANLRNRAILIWEYSSKVTVDEDTIIYGDRALALGPIDQSSGYDEQCGMIRNDSICRAIRVADDPDDWNEFTRPTGVPTAIGADTSRSSSSSSANAAMASAGPATNRADAAEITVTATPTMTGGMSSRTARPTVIIGGPQATRVVVAAGLLPQTTARRNRAGRPSARFPWAPPALPSDESSNVLTEPVFRENEARAGPASHSARNEPGLPMPSVGEDPFDPESFSRSPITALETSIPTNSVVIKSAIL